MKNFKNILLFFKNIALFFLAPFIALAYLIALPIVGMYAVISLGIEVLGKKWHDRPVVIRDDAVI